MKSFPKKTAQPPSCFFVLFLSINFSIFLYKIKIMQEKDFYTALKDIRKTKEPVTIIFTKLSLSKNEGGQRDVLKNVIPGPLRKNTKDEYMIGFVSADNKDEVKHIYIHTILEYINSKGEHFKLKLN